jgi:hypothetical protein
MSAETNSVVSAARRPGPALAPVLAVLADGTPAFAPVGETGGWSAICAGGRSGRSPPTCACTAIPKM